MGHGSRPECVCRPFGHGTVTAHRSRHLLLIVAQRAILDEGNDDGSSGRDCGTWHGGQAPMDVPSSFGPRGQGVPEF